MSAQLHPGTIIALAHGANPATWGQLVSANYPDLVTEFLGLLNSRNIPFVVVGGIALLQHVQGRNTEDIDLIISAPRLADIPELLIQEKTDMFAYGHFHDLRVNILLAEYPLFQHIARSYSKEMDYQVGRLPTATVDGLVLLKLFALPSLYRQFDFDRIPIYEADITQLLARSNQVDAFFLRELEKHLTESDLREISAILTDIRSRLARMKKTG